MENGKSKMENSRMKKNHRKVVETQRGFNNVQLTMNNG